MKLTMRLLTAALCTAMFGALCTRPGFKFTGTGFSISPDIRVDTILGGAVEYNGRGLFGITLVGRSTGDSLECDTLPAGLFFIARSNEVQSIILLKRHVVWFGRNDTAVSLWGFCCNSDLDAPASEDRFDFGKITDNAKMNQLIDLVADKDISGALSTVQFAVWDITDDNRLSQSYIDIIRALPPDTMPLPAAPAPDLGPRLKAGRH